ncbi:SET domain-containing protein SmydA-8 isoform X2 [Aedes albopictus]|uniref:SET domain-containing protein n=1 Tax=Aedes albopictus TaxID=7160 RepID=A0ABM1YHE5_AEDAL|nr:SET domain-containing protein SmydA-8 isoform X2 [Aedes albopictus]
MFRRHSWISNNAVLGRHLTATRPINRGEVIYTDTPLLLGPKIASTAVCLGCHRSLAPQILQRTTDDAPPTDFHHCRHCSWPLCGPACETASQHKDECPLLARSSNAVRSRIHFSPSEPTRKESSYCVVVPLRALLLKRSNPQRFQDTFLTLESHLETRLKTPLYAALRSNLVPFVRDVLGMRPEVTEHELLQIAAILDTNCYDVRLPERDVKVRGLYELGAMMSHHCRPNTKHYFDAKLRLVVVATVDIPKDAVISISYSQPLLATIQRRYAIRQAKCFECCCDRCRDPTEMGTYVGSIICPQCRKTKVVPFDPLDLRSEWQCGSRKCSFRESAINMVRRNELIQATVMALSRSPSPRDEYERFLVTHLGPPKDDGDGDGVDSGMLLHLWNTNVLQVKYALTQLYHGAVDQPEAHLRRQVALCRDLLEVADRLEPGFSPFRGKLLVALRDALLILLGRGEDDLSPQAAPPVDSNGGHVRPTTSVTTMAASAATTTSKRRRQKGRINTEIPPNTGREKSTTQLLQEVEKELAEMRKSDPTLEQERPTENSNTMIK